MSGQARARGAELAATAPSFLWLALFFVVPTLLVFAVEQQHGRFFLDEKPIRWEEPVWLAWHADDGTMLELADVPEARGR